MNARRERRGGSKQGDGDEHGRQQTRAEASTVMASWSND